MKLTGSVVGRLDGVHDDNNKRFSLSLLLSSPTLSLPLSLPATAALRLSRFGFPFLRLFFSRSHLARAHGGLFDLSLRLCI